MRVLFSSIAALALSVLLGFPAAAENPGILEGRVVNGTKGGGPVSALEVTLRSPKPDAEPDQRATTDGSGSFRFAGLSAIGPVSYTLSVNYSGVEYKRQSPAFGPGEPPVAADLPVYDTTSESSDIKVGLAHVVMDVDPSSQALIVMEYQVLDNQGDKTYVGAGSPDADKRESLRFTLPKGATHLEATEGVDSQKLAPLSQGEGFTDSVPFPPGPREVVYSYVLRYDGPNYTFQKPLAYPTGRINLLVSDTGAKVGAPGFSSQQALEIENKKYLLLSGNGLVAGQTLAVELAGLPMGGGAASSATLDRLRLVAIGLPIAVIGLALALFLTKGRRLRASPGLVVVAANDEKAQLIQSLAELDGSYEVGQIGETEYQRLRAEKKRRLAELW